MGCFGCFKLIRNIISMLITVIIVYVILFPLGGLDYIKNYTDSTLHPKESEVQLRAKKYGDFSKIPKEYKLTRAVSLLGANAVVAEYKKTGQKMAVVDPGQILNLSKNNLNANTVDSELKKVSDKFSNLPVKISSLEVGKKGTFKAFNQEVPYVRVKIKVSGNVNKSMEGIIGVINDPNNKNKLIVSGSETGKYQQKIAERYFKNIRLIPE